ncbi:MAG: metallophosphoesterase [Clostridia bacterium]|nr:metallophosphoesterase [Clostridia bacterium]
MSMFSATNTFYHALTRLINLLFAGLFSIYSIGGGAELPKAPKDFTPVVRFAVCSDIHLDGNPTQAAAKRLGYLFDDSYAYAQSSPNYKALDAVLVVGDFATNGKPEEYRLYNEIVDAHIKEGTQTLEVLGNHEFIAYRDEDASVAYDVYKQYVYPEVDRHDVINGYHFIGVSYDEDGKNFAHKLGWLKEQLDAAAADDPDKPIFVYQHPHPFSTVYGSVNWSDALIRAALEPYPQVVDFSGHSHYAASDPRSIWQGSFTAVGTGSLKAYMSNLNYTEGDTDAPGESGGFWIVEADQDGNVRLRLYDVVNRTFFDNVDYYLSDLTNTEDRPYSWNNSMDRDTPPMFPEDAVISAERQQWDAVLSFPDAAGYFEAENYKIIVRGDNAKIIWEGTVLSDYVRAGLTGATADLGQIADGTYEVQITAYSPFEKEGQSISNMITLTTPAFTPGDVNCDGEVNAEDARLALRASVGMEELTDPAAFLAADMDRDGKVTAADARTILRAAVNMEEPA